MAEGRKLKIIVLGEAGVGKTSLLVRFRDGTFREKYKITVVDKFNKAITINNIPIQLEIWDTAGFEKYRSCLPAYFRGSHGVLLIYDVTDSTTFSKLESWLKSLRKENETAEVVIVGTKNEDPDRKRVQRSVVKTYARNEGLDYMETSAKTGDNVNEVFETLARKILGLDATPSQQPSTSSCPGDSDVSEAEDVITLQPQNDTAAENKFFLDLPPIVTLPDDSIIRLCAEKDKLRKDNDSCCVIS